MNHSFDSRFGKKEKRGEGGKRIRDTRQGTKSCQACQFRAVKSCSSPLPLSFQPPYFFCLFLQGGTRYYGTDETRHDERWNSVAFYETGGNKVPGSCMEMEI